MSDQDETYDGETLQHIGIARRSGRYPWGSGGNEVQRSRDFKSYMEGMKAQGLKEKDILEALTLYARANGASPYESVKSPDLRAATASATEKIYQDNQQTARRLAADKGLSNVKIAAMMGTRESTVRGWLKQTDEIKENSLRGTVNRLKEHLITKPFLDVGKGTELYMGIAESKLRSALAMMRDEGYEVWHVNQPQLGTSKDTKLRVLCNEGVKWKEAHDAAVAGLVENVTGRSEDGGANWTSPSAIPVSVPLKRMEVRYRGDGGEKMDGVIEIRRGVPDLDLGANRYAQIRMAVNGTHYLKGMAMYADDLPPGVDIRFNTNKTKEQAPNKVDALKPLKVDKEGNLDVRQPFGATVRPWTYIDSKGKEKTSPLNMVNEEGNWDDWSRTLSAQMLSKQPLALAKQQLGVTQANRKEELDKILRLTNPVVKQKMLEEFADSSDAAAVHLKAAAMPRQSSHVILPMNSMRPNEIYAPNFKTGDKVVLVRYPHGGPFEIPALTVNNRNVTARRLLGTDARDAVGIHHTVAEQLSGADFDGDSVLVIGNDSGAIKSRPPLKQLEGFNAQLQYKIADDDVTTPRLSKKNTQTEMGKISNLITDMNIHRAPDEEMARAIKHSMVVIDAEKHGLDYKRSAQQNGISALKARYQGSSRAGANTLISLAGSDARIPERKPISGKGGIDPVTGEKLFRVTGDTYPKTVTKTNKRTGETTTITTTENRITKGSKMEFAKDARELLRPNAQPIEELYASHANTMKNLANQARLASLAIKPPLQSKAARALYSDEVETLTAKLRIAQRNAPIERRAQILGGSIAKSIVDAHPEYDKDDIKKVQYRSLAEARARTGAAKKKIGSTESPLTEREWIAIQSGAISATTLRAILANADMDVVRSYATPRTSTSLTTGQLARAKQMAAQGRPLIEISEALGIPRTTIVDNLNAG